MANNVSVNGKSAVNHDHLLHAQDSRLVLVSMTGKSEGKCKVRTKLTVVAWQVHYLHQPFLVKDDQLCKKQRVPSCTGQLWLGCPGILKRTLIPLSTDLEALPRV